MADGGIESPTKRTVDAQLQSVRFLAGVEQGRWSVLGFSWPHLYVRVTGRDADGDHPFSQDFHLECEGFPDPGPFVERWAFADTPSFGSRPPKPETGSPGFVDALKDWEPTNGVHGGIYRAWQRHAATHGDWASKRPDEAWRRDRTLTFIMEQLYALVSEQAAWLASRT